MALEGQVSTSELQDLLVHSRNFTANGGWFNPDINAAISIAAAELFPRLRILKQKRSLSQLQRAS
jgi:hypothetical protein